MSLTFDAWDHIQNRVNVYYLKTLVLIWLLCTLISKPVTTLFTKHYPLWFLHLNLTTVKIIHLVLGLKIGRWLLTIHMKIVHWTLISADRLPSLTWHKNSILQTDLNTVTLMSTSACIASHLSLIVLLEAFLSN